MKTQQVAGSYFKTIKALLTLTVMLVFLTGYCQVTTTGNNGNGNGNGNGGVGNGNGKGNNKPGKSDNNTPLVTGLRYSDLSTANTLLTVPTGYGSTGSYLFGDAGGTPRQAYGSVPDMVAHFGFGLGNYRKVLSLSAFVSVNDVSKFGNLSYNVIASRALGKTTSVSVGALHQYADPVVSDGLASYYVSFSHHTKAERSAGNPVLDYTFGYGNGKFLEKSIYDYETGKGSRGTGFFGSLSYAVIKQARINAEWNGMNLAVTSSLVLKRNLPHVFFGVADLTRYTGNKPVVLFGIGQTLGLGH